MGNLLFTEDNFNKKARGCSGGEKDRLFSKLMMQDTNVLILDEPTNHMGIDAIEALNNALRAYEGAPIFVSHDREFVSTLDDHILEIKDQKMIVYEGSYGEYQASKARE